MRGENDVTRLAGVQRIVTRKGGRGEGRRFLFQELGLGDLLGIIHGSVRSSSYVYPQILCYRLLFGIRVVSPTIDILNLQAGLVSRHGPAVLGHVPPERGGFLRCVPQSLPRRHTVLHRHLTT